MLDQQENNQFLVAERARLREVYRKRSAEIDPDTYAPWQPGEMLMLFERRRIASEMLLAAKRFPSEETRCLEIGYGKLGWLGDLIGWGVSESSLFGVELEVHVSPSAARGVDATRG